VTALTQGESMELVDLTEKLEEVSKRYADEYNFKRDNDWFVFKMQEELGELIQIYLMMTERGRSKGLSKAEMRKKFENEIADVISLGLLFARKNDVDVMQAIQDKWLYHLSDEKQNRE
jgi:NTP pyrophosphatase (non-canonical NTP hydrolase)